MSRANDATSAAATWLLLRSDGQYQCYGDGNVPLEYSSYDEAWAACEYLANDYAVMGLRPIRRE